MLGSISASQKATQGLSAGQKLVVATSALKTIANNPRVFTPQVLRSPKLVEQKLLQKIIPHDFTYVIIAIKSLFISFDFCSISLKISCKKFIIISLILDIIPANSS
jgi:hypothetical protein